MNKKDYLNKYHGEYKAIDIIDSLKYQHDYESLRFPLSDSIACIIKFQYTNITWVYKPGKAPMMYKFFFCFCFSNV